MRAEAEHMHDAPLGRSGPYTIHDLFEIEDELHRYEVLDGMLLVSPGPGFDHQWCGDELRAALKYAAPPGVKVVTAFTVRLHHDTRGFIPDLVVTRPQVKTRGRRFLEAEDLLCLVEIVSPHNQSSDRILKPATYAAAGIPYYWRVELQDFPDRGNDRLPVVLVHALDDGCYRLVERLPAGLVGRLTRPFPVEFDPARLLPED